MKKAVIKALATLFVVASVFAMTACDKADPKGTVTPENTQAPEESFEIGVNDNNVYINNYYNIKYVFDENWYVYSQADIDAMNETVLGIVSDKTAKAMKENEYIYDMVAQKLDSSCGINVVITKLPLVQAKLFNKEQLGASETGTRSSFEKMGYTDITFNVLDKEFMGEMKPSTSITAKISGYPYYVKQIGYVKGQYMICITVNSLYTDECDNLLAAFTKAK